MELKTFKIATLITLAAIMTPLLLANNAGPHQQTPRIGNLYHWTEGFTQRTAELVRLENHGNRQVPIFYDPVTRTEMTLPGGVMIFTEPSVDADQLRHAMRKARIAPNFQPVEDANASYMLHTPPGTATLDIAHRLNELPQVDTAIPEWHAHFFVPTQDHPREPEREDPEPTNTEDLHGDTRDEATVVLREEQLNSGKLTPGDVDYFSITIPEGQTSFYAFVITTNFWRHDRYNYFRMVLEDAEQNCLARPCHDEEGVGRAYLLHPGTYYLRIFPSWRMTTGEMTYGFRVRNFDRDYQEMLRCAAIETKYDDTFYGCQWHHNNTTENGYYRIAPEVGGDLNTEAAWDAGFMGQGVHVRIADTGMDIHHVDLRDNVVPSLNNDYRSRSWGEHKSNGGNVNYRHGNHGDMMAGLIAARDNDVGYRGVAPRATVSMHNSLSKRTLGEAIGALRRETSQLGVSSNSFSIAGAPRPTMVSKEWEQAIERALTKGNQGRGTAIFYSGNTIMSLMPGSDTNTSAFQTHPGTMPVCSTSDNGLHTISSGKGYSFWICAPGGSHAPTKLDGYIMFSHSSTSGAVAVAAGTAALIRSANNNLTWRDVKLILAQTAQKAEPQHPEWLTAGPHYLDSTKRYHYNPWYGFGVADAGEAVKLAQDWTNLPDAITDTVNHNRAFSVPDHAPGEPATTKETEFLYQGQIDFVEYVNIMVEFDHPSTRDLRIILESPQGTTSEIIAPYVSQHPTDITGTHRFASSRHLGENPNGTWKVHITDEVAENSGSIESMQLVIMGHQSLTSENNPATGQPTVPEQPMVGDTITPDTSNIADQDGINAETYSYRWIAYDGFTPITVTDSDTPNYQVSPQHYGQRLKLEILFNDLQGNAETANSEMTAPVKAHTPNPPTSITAQVISDTSIEVNWEPAPQPGAMPVQSYKVQWTTDQQTWDQTQSVHTPDGDTHSITIEVHETDAQHHIRVQASNVAGPGEYSQVTTARNMDTTPPQVQDITAESNTITVAYDEALNSTSVPTPEQFTVETQTANVDVSETSVQSNSVTLVLSRYLTKDDVVTLNYRNPSNQLDQHSTIQDAAENPAPEFIAAAVSNITPEPFIDTTVNITRLENFIPELSGYSFHSEGMGVIADRTFRINQAEFSIIYVLQLPGQASIGISGPINQDFVAHIGEHSFRGSSALYTPLITSYTWPIEDDLWPDQDQVELSITPISDDPKPIPKLQPRLPYLHAYKESLAHDGQEFTFQLIFSEDVNVTAGALKDHVIQLTNADLKSVVNDRGTAGVWNVTAIPHSTKEVHLSIPRYTDCQQQHSLCTQAGKPVGNAIEGIIQGPPMTAALADVPQTHDALNDFTIGVIFSESLGPEGKQPTQKSFRVFGATIKQVSANAQDDRRWDVTFTSPTNGPIAMAVMTLPDCQDQRAICTETGKPLSQAGSAYIPAAPTSPDDQDQEPSPNEQPTEPPPAPTNLTATENSDLTITLNWTPPDDDSVTGYQILRRRPQMGEKSLLVLVADTGTAAATFTDETSTDQTRYVYRVKAINSAGTSDRSNYVRIDR